MDTNCSMPNAIRLLLAGCLAFAFPVRSFAQAGTLDTSFNTNVTGSFAAVVKVVVQADGRILLGGSFTQVNGVTHNNIARLNADGSLDSSFNANTNDQVSTVAVQGDGKVVVGGIFTQVNGTAHNHIARLNPDGSLDTDFNASADDSVSTVAAQGDGKIVLGGSFTQINATARNYIARLNANGSLDTDFNASMDFWVDIATLQTDGKILLGGPFGEINGASHEFVGRVNADGSVDSGFNASANSDVHDFGVQPDGKIVIGGEGHRHSWLTRVNADGTPDTAFNNNADPSDQIYAVALQTNGKIIIGGPGFTQVNGAERKRIARLNADGTLDTAFNASVEGNTSESGLDTIAIQPDGKILIGGSFNQVNGTAHAGIARLNGDPLSQLLNIATRLRVQTGENVLIGGFIITGTDPKKVIVLGIGPSLAQFFSGSLSNPTLELYQGDTLLQMNDDWKTDQQADIEATGLAPTNELESAVVRTLDPGSYTAILRGKGDATGIGVVQAYDLNQAANSKFGNIATRGFVDNGDNVMIGGFIVGPAGGATTVVVRAIGPSLANFGINGALQDPTLELHDGNGATIAFNDNWQDDPSQSSIPPSLKPGDPRESALFRALASGDYTAVVRGAGDSTGVGLVEVYNVQ
jgi:uncharacterized delta-60 repeat protein